LTFNNNILDEYLTTIIGSVLGEATYVSTASGFAATGRWLFDLTDGSLVVIGGFDSSNSLDKVLVGGTGSYKDVRGSVTTDNLPGQNITWTFAFQREND